MADVYRRLVWDPGMWLDVMAMLLRHAATCCYATRQILLYGHVDIIFADAYAAADTPCCHYATMPPIISVDCLR